MSFKCPDCGASLTDDSRFCKYCGSKIDDGVKRIEVSGKVDHDVTHRFLFNSEARMKKIEAKKELEEEKLRQQVLLEEEKRKTAELEHQHSVKMIKIYCLLGVVVVLFFLFLHACAR